MTLLDIQNQIVSYFFEQDSISPSKIISRIEFSDDFENDDEKRSAINLVFEKLEKAGLVSKISADKFMLNASFESNVQTVEIYPETAIMLANFVNTYSEASNIEGEEVDILSINDSDIRNACHIGNLLLNVLSSKAQKDKDEN